MILWNKMQEILLLHLYSPTDKIQLTWFLISAFMRNNNGYSKWPLQQQAGVMGAARVVKIATAPLRAKMRSSKIINFVKNITLFNGLYLYVLYLFFCYQYTYQQNSLSFFLSYCFWINMFLKINLVSIFLVGLNIIHNNCIIKLKP